MSEFKDTQGRGSSQRGYNGAALRQENTLGFFQGRCFRAFKEFTATTNLKLVATKPFMLTAQALSVDTGAAKATITVGSTLGGTYTDLSTKFGRNGVYVGAPAPNITVQEGGTITGGTTREVLRVNAGAGAGAASSLIGVRLLPPGTYSIAIVVTGSTSGIYAIEYEELDAFTA